MLSRLTVSNLAVVEQAEAEFASGLNVLTGETGAGKSVLMGALELVLGGRADSSVVRDGAKEARVEATFAVSRRLQPKVAAILDEVGLPPCEDGEMIVRRTIAAGGGGRAWVNDAATTVSTLRRLGAELVDVHGPRANQKLLEDGFQLSVLDSFGGLGTNDGPGAAYAQAWANLSVQRKALEALTADGASEEEMDLLRYQVNEIAEANLSSDDEDIAERHAAAAHAEEIVESANEITVALGGDDASVAETLIRLQPKLTAMARHFPDAEAWKAETEDLTIRVQELSRSVADAVSRLDADPDELEELDARLTTVNRLKRKYGVDIKSILDVYEKKRARLDALENRGERLAELRKAVATAEAAVREAGAALSKRRRAVAERLTKSVTRELHGLGFLQAKLIVSVEAVEPAASGCDRVVFLFAPNPGEAPRPLSAIASSGEIARVMLALKTVLSAHDATDILVFDEIDANIGGEVGEAVGRRMKSVARDHQVIAITHLPQSAVWGDRHLVVSKSVSGGRTRTVISEVRGDERVSEIARMLGGEKQSNVVRKHAEELLSISR